VRNLADRYKVSVITISKALRALEKEGKVNCIPAVGSFVKLPKTDLASNNILPQISFFTISLDNWFTSGLEASIEKACRQRGWTLQVHNSQFDAKTEKNYMNQYARLGSRGAIIYPVANDDNLESLFNLKISKYPFVVLDRPIRGLNVDAVLSDHENGAYLATDYLIKNGHKIIYMLTYAPGQLYSVDARTRGYERALADNGIGVRPEWKYAKAAQGDAFSVEDEDPWQYWYDTLTPLLKKQKEPTAFLTLNSNIARVLVEVCRDLNLDVPRDVSVVTFDDTELMQAHTPPITVIAQRTEEIGQAAVELLERRIQSENWSDPKSIVIDVDLIERKSVRSLNH